MKKESYAVSSISGNLWKVRGSSNVYFLRLGQEKIIIDTGSRSDRNLLEMFLSKLVNFNEITKVICTHLHFDHCSNVDLFPNAGLFASKQEIDDLRRDPAGTVLDSAVGERISKMAWKPIEELSVPGLTVIPTPGHTRGSICLWLPDKRILFSGDTLFEASVGRIDLPTSAPDVLPFSLSQLVEYNFSILCPGHDYDELG